MFPFVKTCQSYFSLQSKLFLLVLHVVLCSSFYTSINNVLTNFKGKHIYAYISKPIHMCYIDRYVVYTNEILFLDWCSHYSMSSEAKHSSPLTYVKVPAVPGVKPTLHKYSFLPSCPLRSSALTWSSREMLFCLPQINASRQLLRRVIPSQALGWLHACVCVCARAWWTLTVLCLPLLVTPRSGVRRV